MKLAHKLVIIHAITAFIAFVIFSVITYIFIIPSLTFIFVSGCFVFSVIVLLFLISLRILKPIQILTHIAQRMASGDLSTRVVVQSKDEIGKMGLAFNDMADKLQGLYANLELKIQEKTAELEKKIKETERMNSFMLGRELKMIEMKKELSKLTHQEASVTVTDFSTILTQEGDIQKAMLNIMEDLQREKAVAETARAKDDAVLASVGDGLIAVDNNGKVLIINAIAEDLLELDKGENLGKDYFESVTYIDEQGRSIPKEEHPVYLALKTGEKITKVLLFTKKNGSKISISTTASPIFEKNQLLDKKIIIGVIAIIRDITKEKEIDRMKTEFISLASHQLRTPLSAIKWFTEMLVGGDAGPLNGEQHEFAKNISDSTERMIQLVNSLLNISRIESGRIIVDPQPTDLKELVQEIINELHVQITARGQTLVVSVHQELPKINVDPRLIRQVYLNLLTNAIKYTPNGGEISVFISRKGDEIISQISDNGYGIPKGQQSRVFEKFFRAENIIKIETDGTGLGLYLIKAIVESSHGKIWYASEEGKGTTFWFSFPSSGMQAKKGEVSLDS